MIGDYDQKAYRHFIENEVDDLNSVIAQGGCLYYTHFCVRTRMTRQVGPLFSYKDVNITRKTILDHFTCYPVYIDLYRTGICSILAEWIDDFHPTGIICLDVGELSFTDENTMILFRLAFSDQLSFISKD